MVPGPDKIIAEFDKKGRTTVECKIRNIWN
jgi:hypothetical protein